MLIARPPGLLDVRRVEPLALRPCDFVTRRILLPLKTLELPDEPPAQVFERGDVFEGLVWIDATVSQAGANMVDVIAYEDGVQHDASALDCIFASPTSPLLGSVDMTVRVRKAVFPAAGLGTRCLPTTKAQPKEMLPLVDKPIIQYGVEEAVASGIDNIILVTGRGKNAIEDHFDVSVELESFLEARGKREQLDEIRKISNMINFAYVRQGEPLGLGHAVLVARELVGSEPFAVILGDDVIDADPPAMRQLIDVSERVGGPVLAVERVPMDETSSYGVIDVEVNPRLGEGVYQVRDLVE